MWHHPSDIRGNPLARDIVHGINRSIGTMRLQPFTSYWWQHMAFQAINRDDFSRELYHYCLHRKYIAFMREYRAIVSYEDELKQYIA